MEETNSPEVTPSEDDLRRYRLQAALEEILGNNRVYFQPPSNRKLQYPCIVYQLDRIDTRYADSLPYHREKAYQVTWMGENPDDDTPDRIGLLPMSSWIRFYTADNLNHHVYRVYWQTTFKKGWIFL